MTQDTDLVMHATVALSGRHMGPTGLGPICQRLNVTVFTESPSLTHGSRKCNMHKKNTYGPRGLATLILSK